MTFKELLNSVQFEDVAPHIVRMDADAEHNLGWYKIHFDMLRLMTPVFHEDANDKVCKITLKDWEDGTGPHLDAYPMEGDLWEHSLTKELVIAPDVQASNEELAACCLWHTSFWGFVEKHVSDSHRTDGFGLNSLDRWTDYAYYRSKAMWRFAFIRRHGGVIPTIQELSQSKKRGLINRAKGSVCYGRKPLNRQKRKRCFRTEFMGHYYERMTNIGDFIVQSIPALSNKGNYLIKREQRELAHYAERENGRMKSNHITTEQLCGLFRSELFRTEEIMSYANEGESGAKYLFDLISKYDMVPMMDGIVVRLVTGIEHDVLTEDEQRLCDLLKEGRKYAGFIFDVNPSLGNQVLISYAAYNSTNTLID